MTANITGYAPLQGPTCLDTLCAQAHGSGHKHLVGLQIQRMLCFLLLLLVPIATVWFNGERILAQLIPERRSAELAGQYLRITMFGLPAFICFEGGKRFVQAQGLFQATTYVLLVASPLNMLMNYLLVWHFGWGYVGAPISVVVTQNIMPILLLLYVVLVDGRQCWGGFSSRALSNWGFMIRLALPGMIMLLADWFAFEMLTLASGHIGSDSLAAQSILVTVTSLTFQIPFPLSIAGSTRVANLIGARLVDAAKMSARVTVVGGCFVGLLNLIILAVLRSKMARLFTQDAGVIDLVGSLAPLVALMQVFDGLGAVVHGLLRGIGRQEFGGYVNIVLYYLVALPLSFGTCFGLNWNLLGLWFGVTIGVTIGLMLVTTVELTFICKSDW